MIEATNQPAVNDIILAHALDKEPAPAAAGPDLADETIREDYIEAAQERVYRARKELQQVYLIAAARELRAKHPEIDSFDFSSDGREPAWRPPGMSTANRSNRTSSRPRTTTSASTGTPNFETLMSRDPIYVGEAIAFRPGA